jgi:hypothetical protein
MALKCVSLESVFAHTLLLIRMIDEKTLAFAVAYENRLHTMILDRMKAGVYVDLGIALETVDKHLLSDLKHEFQPRRKGPDKGNEKGQPKGAAKGLGKGKGKSLAKDTGKAVVKPLAGKWQPGAPGFIAARDLSQQICFSHSPATGLVCAAGTKCPRQHLDTTQPAILVRFDHAKATADATAARRRATGKP